MINTELIKTGLMYVWAIGGIGMVFFIVLKTLFPKKIKGAGKG